MPSSLCQFCHERAASVFMTKVVGGQVRKERMCELCARRRAVEAELFGDLPDELAQVISEGHIDEIVTHLLDEEFTSGEWDEIDPFAGEFEAEEHEADDADNDEEDAGPSDGDDEENGVGQTGEEWSGISSPQMASRRCSRCETTWDRLRQDGRAGCPFCYTVFSEELRGVMERLQRGGEHVGKQPRAAQKRRRRLEHLRRQRDKRLALLETRLQEAVVAERYEEAAQLRDKIKVVQSTFVNFS